MENVVKLYQDLKKKNKTIGLSEDEALEDLIYSYLYQESMKEFNKKHNIY